jgi:uncharacterized protein YeeX (DUF496 family)
MDERRLKDMARGAQQMERGVKQMETRLNRLVAKSIPISQETKDAIQKVKDIISQIRSAKTGDELDAIDMEQVGDYMQSINEGMQKAEMASQFPKILKEAEKELSRQKLALKRAQSRLGSSKIDAGTAINDWQAVIDKLSQAKDQAQQQFSSGQTEEAIESLSSSFFDQMDDLRDKQGIVELLTNIQKIVRTVNLEISALQKRVTALKKSGTDTSRLEKFIAEAKNKTSELKQLAAQSPANSEAIINGLQEMEKIKDEFDQEWSSITGQSLMEVPGLQNFQAMGMPTEFKDFMTGGQGKQNGPEMGPPQPGGFQGGGGPNGFAPPAMNQRAFPQPGGFQGGGAPQPFQFNLLGESSQNADIMGSFQDVLGELARTLGQIDIWR